MTPASEFAIIALDFDRAEDALQTVDEIGDGAIFYKVGMELYYRAGDSILKELRDRGKKIFLDLKINDIPHTIEKAVAAVAEKNVQLLTLFTSRAGVEAAVSGRGSSPLSLFNVSVLTSEEDPQAAQKVMERAEISSAAGADGIICSGWETAAVKKKFPRLKVINPGIRPAGAASDDQKRIVTPVQARAAGADHVVIGRPITRAADKAAAYRAILAELSG